ncbi:TipC family immunity protein, partial [Gemella sanguinis]|uniref:TipC family immunity protein n=1 Tax=Gemella sanguinis TaxID=84135 RepID=UPI00352E9A1D
MKKLSKKWKIFITAMVVLIGGLYGVYKINNRNAFEEMFNSYYNILPIASIDRMGQIKPIPLNDRQVDIINLYYKEKVDNSNIEFSLINFDDEKKIFIISSTLIGEG